MNVPANLVFDPRASFVTPAGLLIPRYRAPQIGGLRGSLPAADQQIGQTAATAATLTSSILVALGTIGGPVGAVIAGIAALGLELANLFGGCGNTCVEATTIVNNAGPLLLQNLQTYLAAPIHYQSLQTAALNNFTLTWNGIVAACQNPTLGTAGQNCISQRQQGACAYHTSPGGWQQTNGVWSYVYPGANGSGSTCWNFFVGYHDPIANDPTVVPDPGTSSTSSSGSSTGGGFSSNALLLFLAVFGFVYVLTEGS